MKNVFGPWLAQLRKPLGPVPKAIPLHQVYMSHHKYKAKVAAEFQVQYPNGLAGSKNHDTLKEQNRIAAELLEKEPVAVREALKREAQDDLEAAKQRHEEARTGLPSDVPEDIEEYVGSSNLSSHN